MRKRLILIIGLFLSWEQVTSSASGVSTAGQFYCDQCEKDITFSRIDPKIRDSRLEHFAEKHANKALLALCQYCNFSGKTVKAFFMHCTRAETTGNPKNRNCVLKREYIIKCCACEGCFPPFEAYDHLIVCIPAHESLSELTVDIGSEDAELAGKLIDRSEDHLMEFTSDEVACIFKQATGLQEQMKKGEKGLFSTEQA